MKGTFELGKTILPSLLIQDEFDRGDGIKAEPRPEKNISAEPEYKEQEPRWWIIAKCSS